MSAVEASDLRVTAQRAQWPDAVLAITALVLIAGKLWLLATPSAFMDEAYYWLWGQHLALSYYDHPPLNAWLQGLSSALFGWSIFGLRAMVALCLGLDILILWAFARRFAPPGEARRWFLVTLVLFAATPIFAGVTAIALPDHVLLTFVLAATLGFASFLERFQRGEIRWIELFAGAVALGLAGLAKYNGALLGVGLALAIVLVPAYRPLLKRWQLYAAGAVAIAMQAPVLLWNIENGFASFGFILGGRHRGVSALGAAVPAFVAGIVVLLLPPLLLAIARLYRAARPETRLARIVAALSTLLFLIGSVFTSVLFHWNLVAYAVLLPFLAPHVGRWLLAVQATAGAIFIAFMIVNFQVVPLVRGDSATTWAYGWDEVAAVVARERATGPVGFLAGTDYPTASLLGFAMQDPHVTSLSPGRDQFDFWFDAEAMRDADALIAVDRLRGLRELTYRQFDSLDRVATIPVERFGQSINTIEIWRGRGFRPEVE